MRSIPLHVVLLPVLLVAFILESSLARESLLTLHSKPLKRIAFGSCTNQYLDQPVWWSILDAEPDLFLHLGDIIYGGAD